MELETNEKIILKCGHKNGAKFEIDLENKTMTWGATSHNLKQFVATLNDKEIVSIASVGEYCEMMIGYSFFSPNIYLDQITECSNYEMLKDVFALTTYQDYKPINRHPSETNNQKVIQEVEKNTSIQLVLF